MNRLEWQEDTASEKISKRFRLYKYISLTVLVVFLLGGLVLFEKDITVENLRYLIKYLDFSSSGSFEEETEIHYNADVSNRFDVFRGDLVVAGESGVTLYDRRGTAVLSDRYTMSHPVCVPGDRYLIVYDLGGYQVRLYNSFALLHEKSFDYAIRSVSVNADGNFCVVTAEKSYHSAVFVYDDDFEEIHRWLSTDKFAMDASLSDEGVLSISAVRALEGDLVADLIELKIGREEPLSVFTYTDELPLDFSASKEGTLLLSENSLRLIREGVQIREQRFESGSLEKVFFGEELFVAV